MVFYKNLVVKCSWNFKGTDSMPCSSYANEKWTINTAMPSSYLYRDLQGNPLTDVTGSPFQNLGILTFLYVLMAQPY